MKKSMKKLIVDVSDEIHKKLKQKALDKNTTIKEIVNNLLAKEFN